MKRFWRVDGCRHYPIFSLAVNGREIGLLERAWEVTGHSLNWPEKIAAECVMVTCVTSYPRHSREPVILSSCSPTMSNNHQWYHQNNQQYPRNDGRQRQPDRQGTGYAGTPPDAVQNGQRLLAVYPPASATPTHHGKTFFLVRK